MSTSCREGTSSTSVLMVWPLFCTKWEHPWYKHLALARVGNLMKSEFGFLGKEKGSLCCCTASLGLFGINSPGLFTAYGCGESSCFCWATSNKEQQNLRVWNVLCSGASESQLTRAGPVLRRFIIAQNWVETIICLSTKNWERKQGWRGQRLVQLCPGVEAGTDCPVPAPTLAGELPDLIAPPRTGTP